MKYGVHALHRRPRDPGLAQIGVQEINSALCQMLPDIAEVAAGQVIDNAYLRTTRQKLIRQRRPNKRRASGYQYELAAPKRLSRCHARAASFRTCKNFRDSATRS